MSEHDDGILGRLRRESLEEQERFRMRAPKPHRYQEQWVNIAHAAQVEHMHGVRGVLLTFDTAEDAEEFLESACTGREIHGGGIRHDTGKHCPVHPNHDNL